MHREIHERSPVIGGTFDDLRLRRHDGYNHEELPLKLVGVEVVCGKFSVIADGLLADLVHTRRGETHDLEGMLVRDERADELLQVVTFMGEVTHLPPHILERRGQLLRIRLPQRDVDFQRVDVTFVLLLEDDAKENEKTEEGQSPGQSPGQNLRIRWHGCYLSVRRPVAEQLTFQKFVLRGRERSPKNLPILYTASILVSSTKIRPKISHN